LFVVFVFAAFSFSRLGGVVVFASFDWLFGSDCFKRGFCLESLILAQDERWRRA
jgi:hypothetical protein